MQPQNEVDMMVHLVLPQQVSIYDTFLDTRAGRSKAFLVLEEQNNSVFQVVRRIEKSS